MKKFFFSLLLLSLSLITAFAQDSTQISAWNNFKTKNPGNWEIRWDKKTGTPAAIYMGKTKQYKGDAKDIASSFLKENSSLLKAKADLSDLKFVQVQRHRDIDHVKFQQTYHGIPIEGAEYMVHILSDGSIDMINGTYYPAIQVSGNAVISTQEAFRIAIKDLGDNTLIRGDTSSTLIIYPKDDVFYLTWKLLIPAEVPYGDWIYYVDASNGNILLKLNDIRDVTGFGNVYPTHPGLSYVTNVSLPRLDGTGYLRGSYANVLNNVTGRAYSANNTFNYSSDDTHFDEVNVYYHIDRYRGNFLGGLGFNSGQITATVHVNYSPGPNNSWFSPYTGQLYFGDGTPSQGFYDFAKEDKIIYHEYTHSMSYSIAHLYYDYTESGAIEEGNADYFPASYTSRTIIGDYAAPNFFPRNISNPRIANYTQYNNPNYYIYNGVNYGYHEPHFGGELWSAAVWDLHNNSGIGATVTDWLVYGGLYRVTSNATFLSYREAIIAEDQAVYGGAHVNTIMNLMAARGIGNPGNPPSAPQNLSYTLVQQGSTYRPRLSWQASPEPDVQGYDIQRYLSEEGYWYSIATVPKTQITYTDMTVIVSALYRENVNSASYKVRAYNGVPQYSAYSNTIVVPYKIAAKEAVFNLSNNTNIIPENFFLMQNNPNPFNPETEITFALPEVSLVNITIFDIMGREIAVIVNTQFNAGYYNGRWRGVDASGKQVGSGIYFYRIIAQGQSGNKFFEVKKMLLLK